jgi:pSer/pThr/pTyr-binding forkhead associated (FHA) protein
VQEESRIIKKRMHVDVFGLLWRILEGVVYTSHKEQNTVYTDFVVSRMHHIIKLINQLNNFIFFI